MEVREKDDETTSSNNDTTTNNDNNNDEKKKMNNNGELLLFDEGEEQAWGTLEELLLVCAVNRHGTKSWDSIADELKKRIKHSSNSDASKSDETEIPVSGGFSSRNCERKYVHLKRRYRFRYDDEEDDDDGGDDDVVLRMVDELRKVRVEELKREVNRHDDSIVSLQLKVKRLEEERESKSKTKMKEEEGVVSDLRVKEEENEVRTGEKEGEPERSFGEKAVATGDSAENRSCNESNSTNHQHNNNNNNKADNDDNHIDFSKSLINMKGGDNVKESKLKSEPEESGLVGPENHKIIISKRRGEPGVAGSDRKASRLSELGGAGSGGGESLSGSRRESTRQQSSEVQSSVSLSKKKRRRFRGGGDSGDELEAEEVSPANKRINAKSQPLVRFLETLRSHKHGSVFKRRLPSQNTEKYRNMIRQHMDLETVQSKLDKGTYCDCHPKFYRDLLLIFTNALLFYRKSSAEHLAARELRRLVIDEATQKTRKPKVQPRKQNPEPQHIEPVVKKPRSSTTTVVCRRRTNDTMQGLSESIKKGDTNNSTTNSKNSSGGKVENGNEEKIKPNHHQKKVDGIGKNNVNNSSSGSILSKKEKGSGGGGGGDNDGNLKKLITRERSNLGNGGLRLSSNNGKKIISKDGSKREKMANVHKDNRDESSEGEGAEKKKITDQKQEKGTPIVLKKQGVANFLKRMKQNSPSSQEKTKNMDSEEEDEIEEVGGRKEKAQNNNNVKKTSGNSKKNVKEVEVGATRRSSGRRGEAEAEAAALRRGTGRPPKRKAAMMSTPDSGKGGRSVTKDSGEKYKKKPRR